MKRMRLLNDGRYVEIAGDTMTGSLTIDLANATALSLGTATKEGGDLIIYRNTSGRESFKVDADGLTTFKSDNAQVSIGELTYLGVKYPEFQPLSSGSTKYFFFQGGVYAYDPSANFPVVVLYEHSLGIPSSNMGFISYNNASYGGLILGTTAYDITFAPNTNIVRPFTDGNIDLGTATREWKDLYIDGNAYIDSLRVDVGLDLDNIDINATGISTVTAVIPVTVEGGTKYIPVYDSYS